MAIPVLTVHRWLVIQAVVWTSTLSCIAGFGVGRPSFWLCGIVGMAGSFAWLWFLLRCGRRAADYVTLVRFLGLCAFVAFIAFGTELGWELWLLAVAVIAGDLLDGWVARRWGGSDEGALLDQETDQLAILSLSVTAVVVIGAGPWTLLLPGIKYLYILGLASVGIPAHDPKPQDGDNRRGKCICALVMILLLAALCPVMNQVGARICTIVAVLALAFSFSSDARFLWAHRANLLRNR